MRRKTLIFLLLFVIVAGVDSVVIGDIVVDNVDSNAIKKVVSASTVVDSSAVDKNIPDTASMDSLQLLVWKRNKAIDDSLAADSANRQRKNGIDSPVQYTAEDSMTYDGESAIAHLYGKSHVKYQDMDLESDQIFMSLDSSLVHATGSLDTTGQKFGTPVFMRRTRWRLTSRRRKVLSAMPTPSRTKAL